MINVVLVEPEIPRTRQYSVPALPGQGHLVRPLADITEGS